MAFGDQGTGFRNQLIPFFEAGNTIVINGSGLFSYNGVPATGNLVGSGGVTAGGTDAEGNAYLPGWTTYKNIGGNLYAATSMESGQLSFWTSSTGPGGPYFNQGTISGGSGVVQVASILEVLGAPGALSAFSINSVGAFGTTPLATIEGVNATDIGLLIANGTSVSGQNQFQADVNGNVQAYTLQLEKSVSTGLILQITNLAVSTGNPNVQLTGTGATDNMVGVEIGTDSNNRWKINASGRMQWGPGNAGQDCSLYRSSAGIMGVDTLEANIGGSVEVWHTLGTLAGAVVAKGRFRLLPDGEVKVEVDFTFGVATGVPINFSVTLPAAYQVPGAVDIRAPMAQTNAAGGIGRMFIGSAGGGNPGLVQFTTLGAGNAIGTYSAYFSYSIL